MALFRSLLRATALGAPAGADRAEVLRRTIATTNDYIAREHGSANMFATTFAGLLDPATGSLLYVNAGHEAPLVIAEGGAIRARLAPTGAALGMLEGLPFGQKEETLAPGETLLAYTDGVTEAKGADGFWGEERLAALVEKGHASAEALLADVDAALAAHVRDEERSDDVTALVVRRVR